MAALKTKKNKAGVKSFLASIEHEGRRKDGEILLELFTELTKEKPTLWGESIIGFGEYHYKSDRSSQEGDWPLVGFSPRKQNLSLYIVSRSDSFNELLKDLGKYKSSKGCLYINKLADVDLNVLKKLIKQGYKDAVNDLK